MNNASNTESNHESVANETLDIRALYQELIMDHGTEPRNFFIIENPTHFAEGDNPLCGDKIQVFLDINSQDDRIQKISFQGKGCAISTASASLMTEALIGKTKKEASLLFSHLQALLKQKPVKQTQVTQKQLKQKQEKEEDLSSDTLALENDTLTLESLGKLAALSGVRAFPARIKCATLAWHALMSALNSPSDSSLSSGLAPEDKEQIEQSEETPAVFLNVASDSLSHNTSLSLSTSPSINSTTSLNTSASINTSPSLNTSLSLKEKVQELLLDIYDPEIPVNIYDLGLIYSLETNEQNEVRIEMTLTSPACPVAQTFPGIVQERILSIPNVSLVSVNLVWEPPWTRDRMSEAAKLQLNMF